ncbi:MULTISPECIES: Rv3235 family protein [unclassified Janibacter]|uniref:Rv3235 family protein n=1 Tax=unclassified Janibacter TaxID=2649294 RepID=UPI003D000CB9
MSAAEVLPDLERLPHEPPRRHLRLASPLPAPALSRVDVRALPEPPLRTRFERAPQPSGRQASTIEAEDDLFFGPQATSTSELPEPTAWVGQISQALVEVMAGTRPATQLARWASADVYDAALTRSVLAQRRRRPGSPAPRTVVRRVHVQCPADGVVEAAVTVLDGGRVRAIAMRLSGLDGRWIVDALQIA